MAAADESTAVDKTKERNKEGVFFIDIGTYLVFLQSKKLSTLYQIAGVVSDRVNIMTLYLGVGSSMIGSTTTKASFICCSRASKAAFWV